MAQQNSASAAAAATATVYLLTGDIGGTNSRMSLYALTSTTTTHTENEPRYKAGSGTIPPPTITRTYRNEIQYHPRSILQQENAFVECILKPFLSYCWDVQQQEEYLQKLQENDSPQPVALSPFDDQTVIVCCIASAGVVTDNRVNLTNLDGLLICGNQIEQDDSTPLMKSIVRCVVINDFVAQGYGCLTLQPTEVQHLYGPFTPNLQADPTSAKGPKVCVGAGTGLGECFLTQSLHVSAPGEDPYSCFPSEGGHVEFSPRNDLEVALFKYLSEKFPLTPPRISVERVVSGTGLANVYEFLAYQSPDDVNATVHEQFLKAGDDQGRVVSDHAKDQSCKLCVQAMSIMMSAYGCEVGSSAIKWIPTGGLFVSGGLTPKNLEYIHGLETAFMKSYLHKGRVSSILERIPLFAVLVQDLGVRGAHRAAWVAYQAYMQQQQQQKH